MVTEVNNNSMISSESCHHYIGSCVCLNAACTIFHIYVNSNETSILNEFAKLKDFNVCTRKTFNLIDEELFSIVFGPIGKSCTLQPSVLKLGGSEGGVL